MSNVPDTPQSACCLPLTRRGKQRRTSLLQAANTLFLEKGFNAVSLDDIVQVCGGSKAAIYQYFGNKKGLLAALFEYRSENFFRENPPPERQPGQTLHEIMLLMAKAVYTAFTDPNNIAFMRLVVEESQRDPELAQLAYDTGPKRGLLLIAGLLEQAHQHGEINCPRPYESATLFFGMLRHAQWRLLVGLPPLEPHLNADHYLKYLVERFLAGHHLSS
ncbi:TetR/AcrR family transcriptional regulator [Alkanindiges sp. WGS2144]|uniref:TetR/AcrR family transcriptional regulator n=1 Tax=Alkanindiges sp. WGS2144 TaxID=3366808 RepID=UPI0037520F4F